MPMGAIGSGKTNNATPFVLAKDEVAYVGEPIALVIAHSRYIAEDAANLVEVDYEALPVVHDAREAIAPGSPAVRRELNSNIMNTLRVAYGDIDAAFAKAAHVFSDELLQHRGCGQSISVCASGAP